MISIAIDGPSSSGKSTFSKLLSKKLGFINFDTGSLYRAVAYYFCVNSLKKKDIKDHFKNIHIKFVFEKFDQKLFLKNEDITDKISGEEISIIASELSALPEVREFLLNTQREAAKNNNIIMNGRDVGTVILPNADIKFFITASAEIRAKWRYEQIRFKNKNIRYKDVLKNIKERDFNDSTRPIAPLVPAKDAIIINNSKSTVSEIMRILLGHIKNKFPDLVND